LNGVIAATVEQRDERLGDPSIEGSPFVLKQAVHCDAHDEPCA
jgi:hypothetical protein